MATSQIQKLMMNIKKYKYNIPLIGKILKDRDNLLKERDILIKTTINKKQKVIISEIFPPGHFYSTIPNIKEIKKNEKKIFHNKKNIPKINLNEAKQIELFKKLSNYYKDLDFPDQKQRNKRYYYKNPAYGYGDSIILYSIIRHFRPQNIIEIGSGFSSCIIIDTNEKFFKNKINCTFIEPYSSLFKSLIKSKDKIKIIESNLQDIPKKYFKLLKENDILFIDSTHVSKVGSDVNYLFSEIIPSLNPRVLIHFHDIFHPFEYPKEWIYKGFFWNENYMLRSFLEYNDYFEIVFFNHFFYKYHQDLIRKKMPLILKCPGASIWIKKL